MKKKTKAIETFLSEVEEAINLRGDNLFTKA